MISSFEAHPVEGGTAAMFRSVAGRAKCAPLLMQ